MRHQVRPAITAVVAAVLVAGCSQGSISASRGDTTTPAPAGQPVSAQTIDSLIIPVEQVPGGLHDDLVDNQPAPPASSDDCQPNYTSIGHIAPLAYRSVHYSGLSNRAIVQTIEIYPNPADAAVVFGHLTDQLSGCKGGGEVSVDAATATAASWHAQGFSPSSGVQETTYATDARIAKNVVFSVTAQHFSEAPQESRHAAASVADQIAAKINNAL